MNIQILKQFKIGHIRHRGHGLRLKDHTDNIDALHRGLLWHSAISAFVKQLYEWLSYLRSCSQYVCTVNSYDPFMKPWAQGHICPFICPLIGYLWQIVHNKACMKGFHTRLASPNYENTNYSAFQTMTSSGTVCRHYMFAPVSKVCVGGGGGKGQEWLPFFRFIYKTHR